MRTRIRYWSQRNVAEKKLSIKMSELIHDEETNFDQIIWGCG